MFVRARESACVRACVTANGRWTVGMVRESMKEYVRMSATNEERMFSVPALVCVCKRGEWVRVSFASVIISMSVSVSISESVCALLSRIMQIVMYAPHHWCCRRPHLHCRRRLRRNRSHRRRSARVSEWDSEADMKMQRGRRRRNEMLLKCALKNTGSTKLN